MNSLSLSLSLSLLSHGGDPPLDAARMASAAAFEDASMLPSVARNAIDDEEEAAALLPSVFLVLLVECTWLIEARLTGLANAPPPPVLSSCAWCATVDPVVSMPVA